MNRRDFIRNSAAAFAVSGFPRYLEQFGGAKKRVGLIGCGWYGKCDLFRLIQVAPVEVVSLCDVDKQDARRGRRHRRRAAGVEEEAADLRRLPRDAQGEGPRHRPGRHARPLARPADDRRRARPGPTSTSEADQRGRRRGPGDARRRPQAQARRAGRHAAAQHAAPDRGPRPDRQGGQARQDRPVEIYCYYHMRASEQPARRSSRRSTSTTRCGPARPRCGRTTRSSTRAAGGRSWSTATASSATCASTCSTWSAGCSTSAGRSGSARPAASSCRRRASRTSPTRRRRRSTSATCTVVWQHRTWGNAARPGVPLGGDHLRRQGDAQGRASTATTSSRTGKGEPTFTARRATSWSKYPEDKTEKDLEQHVAPAIRGHMQDFLAGDRSRAASRSPTSSRATSRRRAASWPTSRCSSAGR